MLRRSPRLETCGRAQAGGLPHISRQSRSVGSTDKRLARRPFRATLPERLRINSSYASSEPDVMMRSMYKVFLVLVLSVCAGIVSAQDKTTGGLKGRVRVEVGNPSAVSIIVRQGEREITRVATNKNGEFTVDRLKPGVYGVTFRKPGLSIGTIENVEVKAGKIRSLGDRLVLTLDEGSIAFIRGSVFDPNGRSAPNVRVELARVEADGSVKKIDGRVTNEIGSFVFRLTPDAAKYRITAKAKDAEAVSQDVEVDGAAVYRIALTVKP